MKHLALSLLLSVLPISPVLADDWALDGYDPVGYLTQNQALPGHTDIATMWQGRIWHFVSEENRSRFESDPKSFAPAFEGFCPVMLAEGRHEFGNPRFFLVLNGKLYLFRSDNAQQRFARDPQDILAKAGEYWSRQ